MLILVVFGGVAAIVGGGRPSADRPAPAVTITAASPVSTRSAAASPKVETRTVTETQAVPYTTTRVDDAGVDEGTEVVRTKGVNGISTLTYEVTYTDGLQTGKRLVSQEVTMAPVTEVVAVGTRKKKPAPAPPAPPAQQCDPNYAGACVPIASDVDCAGGTGNGPAYVKGPVRVIGRDIYDLDSDGDGIGCES